MGQFISSCLCPDDSESVQLIPEQRAAPPRSRTNIIIIGAQCVGKSTFIRTASAQLSADTQRPTILSRERDDDLARSYDRISPHCQTYEAQTRYERTIAVDVAVVKLHAQHNTGEHESCDSTTASGRMWMIAARAAADRCATSVLRKYIARNTVDAVPVLYDAACAHFAQKGRADGCGLRNKARRSMTMSTSPITSSITNAATAGSGCRSLEYFSWNGSHLDAEDEARVCAETESGGESPGANSCTASGRFPSEVMYRIDLDDVLAAMDSIASARQPSDHATSQPAGNQCAGVGKRSAKPRRSSFLVTPWSSCATVHAQHLDREAPRCATNAGVRSGEQPAYVLLWDTSGDVKFVTIMTPYVCSAHVIALMYDPTSMDSLDYIQRYWARRIRDLARTRDRKIVMLRNSSSALPLQSARYTTWQKSRIHVGCACPTAGTDETVKYSLVDEVDRAAVELANREFDGCPIVCVESMYDDGVPRDMIPSLVDSTLTGRSPSPRST